MDFKQLRQSATTSMRTAVINGGVAQCAPGSGKSQAVKLFPNIFVDGDAIARKLVPDVGLGQAYAFIVCDLSLKEIFTERVMKQISQRKLVLLTVKPEYFLGYCFVRFSYNPCVYHEIMAKRDVDYSPLVILSKLTGLLEYDPKSTTYLRSGETILSYLAQFIPERLKRRTAMDNNYAIPTSRDGEESKVVLIVPPEAKEPSEYPLPVFDMSWSGLVEMIEKEIFPAVIKINANDLAMLEEIANYHDIEIKTLTGFGGDYPSFWMITSSKFPQVTSAEIELIGEDSSAAGGSGIDPKKRAKPDFKQVDDDLDKRRSDLGDEEWNNDVDDAE